MWVSILKILSNQESLIKTTILRETAWAAHVPFARWLVSELKPKTFVELGVETGHSFFNIAETMHKIVSQPKCFAVDTWLGDDFTTKYSEDVYNGVVEINQEIFQNQNVLLRMQFDTALSEFENKSIDLLHIDGSHRYEDIKNDFQKWLPKVSENGVVLIHDTQVRDPQFGVYDFWLEITQSFRHIEFFHGFGLGVVFVGEKSYQRLIRDYSIHTKEFIGLFEALGARYLKNIEMLNTQSRKFLESENQNLEISNRALVNELVSMKNSRIWKASLPYRYFKDKTLWYFLYIPQVPFFRNKSHKSQNDPLKFAEIKFEHAKIAVIFHIFYEDEIPYMVQNLAVINLPFDLYVTSHKPINESHFTQLSQIRKIKIDYCENKGRDILPFIRLFQKYNFYGYQIILKVHTKKSYWLTSPTQSSLRFQSGELWKQKLLSDLLGSEKNFIDIFKIFENDHEIGLITSSSSIIPINKNLSANKLSLQIVMRKLSIRRIPSFSKFPAGSMYWFRPEIFSREMMQNMSSLIFDEELGQDDGTLAHGFERIVGVLVQKSKYFMAEHEFKSNNV
jgi:hypothetical protein